MTIDDRSFVMQVVMTLDVPSSVVFFYPQLIPIHTVNADSDEVPFPIRTSIENMEDSGVYLLGKILDNTYLCFSPYSNFLLTVGSFLPQKMEFICSYGLVWLLILSGFKLCSV